MRLDILSFKCPNCNFSCEVAGYIEHNTWEPISSEDLYCEDCDTLLEECKPNLQGVKYEKGKA